MNRQYLVFLTNAGIRVDSRRYAFRSKGGLLTCEAWVYPDSTVVTYNETKRCLDSISVGRNNQIDFTHYREITTEGMKMFHCCLKMEIE